MVVALDDDPTGTQTVRDVPVLTKWSAEGLRTLLDGADPLAFLLTNSRSLPGDEAVELASSSGRTLRAASTDAGRGWAVISRSDSTLRGHYPAEVDALVDALAISDARVVLAPFFGDGGRVTLDGVHYLRRDDRLVPAAETEFARDPVFGYRSSDLREWVAERSTAVPHSRVRPVAVMTLDPDPDGRSRRGPGCAPGAAAVRRARGRLSRRAGHRGGRAGCPDGRAAGTPGRRSYRSVLRPGARWAAASAAAGRGRGPFR